MPDACSYNTWADVFSGPQNGFPITGDSLNLTRTSMATPLRFEGAVDGVPVYFHVRYGYWIFAIAADAVAGSSVWKW